MFKQLLTASIAITSVFAPVAAEAYTVRNDCGVVFGYEACVNYQDAANPDVVMWQGPKGLERIEISCFRDNSYDWKSRGPHTVEMIDMVAMDFCSN